MPKKTEKEFENGSALKNIFNTSLLQRISNAVTKVHPQFDDNTFQQLMPQMEHLEMKPRVHFLRDHLQERLPADYPKALSILLRSLEYNQLSGFDIWPFTEFVQTYGLSHFELSLNALQKMTPLFTAEWAVRPFLQKNFEEALSYLLKCASSQDEHVRRWASEGARPRLPWGGNLQSLIKDPSPTQPILEKLKFDSSLYVRKSVANHLNDITKDHPDYVIRILKRWKLEAQGEDVKKIDWIIRHALRTLIKQGHPKALALIGVSSNFKVQISKLKIRKAKIKLGEKVEFTFQLSSLSTRAQKLVVDYVIHFMKSNHKTAAKVFKLKTFELRPKQTVTIAKAHPIQKITTRQYYSGRHFLEIQVNGKILKRIPFSLI